MVEAMACGTPVVAMACGSVPEVVADGVSGFVCSTLRDFIDAVARAGELDRAACRSYAEARFSDRVMADGYERAYGELVLADLHDPERATDESRVYDASTAVIREPRGTGREEYSPHLSTSYPVGRR